MRRRDLIWPDDISVRRSLEALTRKLPRYPPSLEEDMQRLRKRIEWESHKARQMAIAAGLDTP